MSTQKTNNMCLLTILNIRISDNTKVKNNREIILSPCFDMAIEPIFLFCRILTNGPQYQVPEL